MPGFESSGWFGIVAPRGVPATIVQRISQDARTVLEDASVRERLIAMGFNPVGNTPEAMEAEMADERKRWAKLIKEKNIRATP